MYFCAVRTVARYGIFLFAVASRPTAGRLGHVLADRQSVVQADGQLPPAQRQVALQAKYQYLCTENMRHKRI